ncbi:hypothetical protein [Streptomyces sp. NPDC003863]
MRRRRVRYQHLEGQVSSGEVLRGYNPRDPATTAPHTENDGHAQL